MAPLLSITHISTVDNQARQKVIRSLSSVADFAQYQEADVIRFAITIPRIEGDETSIWVIEEYANQTALNKHLGSKAVADHMALFSTANLLAAPPRVLTYATFTAYSRPTVLSHPDPYILIAAWDYNEGTRGPALNGWQDYNDGCKRDEPGTMVQVLAKDENDPDKVGGVMAFDSEQYFWETHVAGPHTTGNKAKYGDIRTRTDLRYFKLVGGFLHKAERGSRL